jgi:hypothetical protein
MASLFGTLVCQTLKIKFRFGMHCLEAVHLIEPADNDIGVVAIDFNAVAPPSGLFGCDQGRTTPGGDVENDSSALGAIQNASATSGAGGRRPLRYATRASAARTPAQRAWEERVVRLENAWKNPVLPAPSVFVLSSPDASEFHPPTF